MGAPINLEPQPGVYFVAGGTYNFTTGTFTPGTGSGGDSGQVFTQRTDIAVGTASTQITPAVTTAHRVTITHPGGANVVFVAVGKAATLNSGVPIYPGGSWTSDPLIGQVNGITSSGTEIVTPFY